ncbi:MAG: AmmeMemoRadiSam system protein A [Nitrospinae bacterium]|nr:AmmeMemoRadiSam system protein A [Nitrospinota bacterium]
MNRGEDSGRPLPPCLTEGEKRGLLALARGAIAERFGMTPTEPPPGATLPRWSAGAFVTLHDGGALRGCIGQLVADGPLADVVRAMAVEAAFGDRRFAPLSRSEFPRIAIEISVMSPPAPVAGWEAIDIPRHGVVMTCKGRRGVFLPQVAAERGWDRETTLDHLALKVGLSPGAWREGATFSVFEAEVFGE